MHAGNVAALGASGMRRHKFGGFDLDAMDRGCFVPGGLRVGVGIVPVIVRCGGLRVMLPRKKRGLGFASGFERFAHGCIDVVTAFDEWHGTSKDSGEWLVMSG